MKIIRNVRDMCEFSRKTRLKGKTIGFVPTMGALHQGHLSLIKQSRKDSDITVVSIFVNPIQFGPREDFKKYPRNLERDTALCQKAGVDAIFYPKARTFYPVQYKTYVTVEDLSDVLCGRFRPGHFQGVATVVTKLFNIVQPDTAYFGQKDAQQALIIKRLVRDLNMPVRIKVLPTIREQDGLAKSSRNVYLTNKERKDAAVLYQALCLAKNLVKQGRRDTVEIIRQMRQLINKKKTAKIQYISIVDLNNLRPVSKIKGRVLLALAVYIGKVRLIDNAIIFRDGSRLNLKVSP